MSFIEKNIDNIKIGFNGEGIVRDWFIKKKYKFMQIDIMFEHNNFWALGEIKSQVKFKAPPFDGHGLPEWQFEARLKFQQDTGIPAYLIIYDLEEKCLYIASFDKLLKGEFITTKGKKPRKIFDIQSFSRLEL
jgi:hypothetical protein